MERAFGRNGSVFVNEEPEDVGGGTNETFSAIYNDAWVAIP